MWEVVWVLVRYPSDLDDEQWELLEPLLVGPGKRGPRHDDLRTVVDAVLYVVRTGCPWRYLPHEYGRWTRAWSQFRRWARKGTWARVLAALHEQARTKVEREKVPSMVVIDSSMARGASQGGATFHARGGPYGMTLGVKRVVAVDITGLPVAAVVVAASVGEAAATEHLLAHMHALGITYRLEVAKVDQGIQAGEIPDLVERAGVEVERVFWLKETKPKRRRVAKHDVQARLEQERARRFKPLPYTWRVEVAHGRIGRSRRLAKSFENTARSASAWLRVACVNLLLQDPTDPDKLQPKPRHAPLATGT